MNKGFDYGAPGGTPVPAVQSGTVIQAGPGKDGWSTSVKVRDANGFVHNYGHLGNVNVRVGQNIERGQMIGDVGAGIQGVSTGPHLSYDVYPEDKGPMYAVDPSPWVGGGGMNNYEPLPDTGSGSQMQPLPGRGPARDFDSSQIVPLQGGGDTMMGKITAIMEKIADPKTDPTIIPALEAQFQAYVSFWKIQNPYTPIEVAIQQATLDAANRTREDARTDANARRDQDRFTAEQNATQQNYQNQTGYNDRLTQREYDVFGAQRQYGADRQNLADAQFANDVLYHDRKVGESDRELNTGIAHVNRAVSGKGEGRQRAEYITDTQLEAAQTYLKR